MGIRAISKTWKIFLTILLFTCIGAIIINASFIDTSTRYISDMGIPTMLKIKINDPGHMTESTVEKTVEILNALRAFKDKEEISIQYKKASEFDIDNPKFPIGWGLSLYYQDTVFGKKITYVVFGYDFLRDSYLNVGSEEREDFTESFNKIQKRSSFLNYKTTQDDRFISNNYSVGQLEMMKSYVPIIITLNQEIIYFCQKARKELKVEDLFVQKVDTLLKESIYISKNLIYQARHNWPLVFGHYVLRNHGKQVYFWNVIFLLPLILLLGVLSFLASSIFTCASRRDFWQILAEELESQGMSLNFLTIVSLTFMNWRLILFPKKAGVAEEIIQKECAKLKERRERKVIRDEARKVIREIEKLDDIEESYFGTLKYYYKVATDPEGNIGRAWRNLIKLDQQLKNIKKRQEGMSAPSTQVTQSTSEKKGSVNKKAQKNTDLINYVGQMLPEDHQLNLSDWTQNNLQCLMRALVILPKMHPEAVTRLLSRGDLKGIMMRRDPFMKAIEVENKQMIFDRLNITLDQKTKKRSKENISLKLPSELKVIVVGLGHSFKKKDEFQRIMNDLGVSFGGFVDADNLRKLQSIIQSSKKEDTLIVLTRRHLSHKSSILIKDSSHNTVFVESLSSERLKYELVKGYNSLQ